MSYAFIDVSVTCCLNIRIPVDKFVFIDKTGVPPGYTAEEFPL
jgi:hypothetical protein